MNKIEILQFIKKENDPFILEAMSILIDARLEQINNKNYEVKKIGKS